MAALSRDYIKCAKKYALDSYQQLLMEEIYKDEQMVKTIFASKMARHLFDAALTCALNGENFNAEVSAYERQTGDKNLRHYLYLYRHYAKETQNDVCKNGKVIKANEKQYFTALGNVCKIGFTDLYTDLINGNRWWEVDSASSFRRQLMDPKLVIVKSKFLAMCEKYLGRKVDYATEVNPQAGRNAEDLVKELDLKMAQKGLKPVYAWFETIDGVKTVVESKDKPIDGRYHFIRYRQEKTAERSM
ncbi:MAG: hypothetical protein E7378_00585 [Clostridiales bacterium]|nr:hypothetical protein [Clostridiales bacterium]